MLIASGFVVLAVITVKNLLGVAPFTTEFLMGLVFWIIGWFMAFTPEAATFFKGAWLLGGLYAWLIVRRLEPEQRDKQIAIMTRVTGWLFAVLSWLLMTVDLWG